MKRREMTSNGSWACPQIHGREVCGVGRATEEMSDGIGVCPTFRADVAVGGSDAEFVVLQLGAVAGPELGEDAACRAGERRLGRVNLWRRDAQNSVYRLPRYRVRNDFGVNFVKSLFVTAGREDAINKVRLDKVADLGF